MDYLRASASGYFERLLVFLPNLIAAGVIFIASLYLAGLLTKLVRRKLEERKVDPELRVLLGRITKWTVVVAGTIGALRQMNFDLTGFLAGLGIVGLTIGFALQDVTKNFVAGVLLLLQQPFGIGDVIEVNDYTGTVTDIRTRATHIRTFDGLDVIIPNGDVYMSAIKNYSHTVRRRLAMSVGVGYQSDLDLVTETLQTALSNIPGVITDDPAPQVVFEEFGDSSINLTAYFWIDLSKIGFFDAQTQSIKVTKIAFEQAGIEIPYPTHTMLTPGNQA